MSRYSVESFVRIEESFVSLSQLDGVLPDADYIEGMIELQIAASKILSERHWDLIDQLWEYLIDGVSDLIFRETDLDCYFPDQPLRLSMKSTSQTQIEVSIGSDAYRVDKSCFAAAIGNGGRFFFTKMLQLVPSGEPTWRTYLERCESLIAATGEAG